MKRYLMILSAVWLMLGFAGLCEAGADETVTMYVHVQEDSFLYARHDPTRDSAIEMRLYRGNIVTVLVVDGGWAQIEGGESGTCWCCVDYLTAYPPDDDAIPYIVESNGRVRVRATPDGQTVRYVNNGDTVAVQFIMDGWAYIGDGYMMSKFLRIVKDE